MGMLGAMFCRHKRERRLSIQTQVHGEAISRTHKEAVEMQNHCISMILEEDAHAPTFILCLPLHLLTSPGASMTGGLRQLTNTSPPSRASGSLQLPSGLGGGGGGDAALLSLPPNSALLAMTVRSMPASQ